MATVDGGVRLEGELNATDLENLKHLAGTMPGAKRQSWSWFATVVVLISFPYYGTAASLVWARWVPAAVGVALFLVLWGRDRWGDLYHPFFGRHSSIELDEDGLRAEGPDGSARIEWRAFTSSLVGTQMVCLMVGRNVARWLPRRWCASAEAWNQLVALVQRKLPPVG